MEKGENRQTQHKMPSIKRLERRIRPTNFLTSGENCCDFGKLTTVLGKSMTVLVEHITVFGKSEAVFSECETGFVESMTVLGECKTALGDATTVLPTNKMDAGKINTERAGKCRLCRRR